MAVACLANLLRAEHVDILQTHIFWPSLLGLSAWAPRPQADQARTRRGRGAPSSTTPGPPGRLVSRHHSDFATTFNGPIHCRLEGIPAPWADGVLAASAPQPRRDGTAGARERSSRPVPRSSSPQ